MTFKKDKEPQKHYFQGGEVYVAEPSVVNAINRMNKELEHLKPDSFSGEPVDHLFRAVVAYLRTTNTARGVNMADIPHDLVWNMIGTMNTHLGVMIGQTRQEIEKAITSNRS
ncbi:hypothetical protein [Erwinia sp. S59]|uniref:hypothetical protein n=1 Tax=Erwinia sp. S59 TaxID=2769340 RepID=UPI00190C923F|nr:hypothetical protein [Erwinia sp. S59]MBK0092799.1 hypothetical protein [Erwinia sp. S59]